MEGEVDFADTFGVNSTPIYRALCSFLDLDGLLDIGSSLQL